MELVWDGSITVVNRTSTFLWDYCSEDSRYTRYGEVARIDCNMSVILCRNALLDAWEKEASTSGVMTLSEDGTTALPLNKKKLLNVQTTWPSTMKSASQPVILMENPTSGAGRKMLLKWINQMLSNLMDKWKYILRTSHTGLWDYCSKHQKTRKGKVLPI